MSRTTQTITHKIGATFGYSGLKVLPAGTWDVKCTGNDPDGNLVQEFDASLALDATYVPPVSDPTLQRFLVTIRAESDDTGAWAAGVIKVDVAFFDTSSPKTVVKTNTFTINAVEAMTDVD